LALPITNDPNAARALVRSNFLPSSRVLTPTLYVE